MRMSKTYEYRLLCPITGQSGIKQYVYDSLRCSGCGEKITTYTEYGEKLNEHLIKKIGRFLVPNWFEEKFLGKVPEFVVDEEMTAKCQA